MNEEFEVTWEAEDGFCGGSHPHTFAIDASRIEGMTEKELSGLFWAEVESDFQEKVHPFSPDKDRFVSWAKEQQKKMAEAEANDEQ